MKTNFTLPSPIQHLRISPHSPYKPPQRVAWSRRVIQMLGVCFALVLSGLAQTAFAATCSCAVTCTTSNGPSYTQSWNEADMSQLPPGPQAGKCKDRCQATLNQKTSEWALAGKWCKTGSCDGTSQLGTLNPVNLDAVSFDNSNRDFCPRTPGPETNPCCPEFTKVMTPGKIRSFFKEGTHTPGQPYTMTMDTNGTFSNQLETSLKAWADWLKADGCAGVTGFKLEYKLYNTNSTVKPTTSVVPNTYTASTSTTLLYLMAGVVPPGFVWNVTPSPNWWFVKVIATPIGANGQAVACAKTDNCFDRFYTGWIDDAMTAARVMPGAGGAASSLRFIE